MLRFSKKYGIMKGLMQSFSVKEGIVVHKYKKNRNVHNFI